MKRQLGIGLVLACCWLTTAYAAGQEGKLTVVQVGQRLLLQTDLPTGIRKVELRIQSDRNKEVTRFTTLAEDDPQRDRRAEKYASMKKDTWYPVVDVRLEHGFEGVCRLGGKLVGHYTAGGPYFDERIPISREIRIPLQKLECWENSVCLPKDTTLDHFELRKTYPALLDEFGHTLVLLSPQWSGTLGVWIDVDGKSQLWASVEHHSAPDANLGVELRELRGSSISRNRLFAALKALVEDGLRRQNTNPNSPTVGSFHTFYDLEARTHRTSYWLWGGSPLVKMMLDAVEHPEIETTFGRDRIIEAAQLTGDLYLKHQVRKEGHPSRGAFLVIWTRSPEGYTKWVGTSDSGIMHRWVMLPLYRATGRAEYLDATRFWCEQKGELLKQHEILPHFFLYDQDTFSDNILDETGWDPEGHAALYALTREETHRQIAKEYMDKHLAKFQTESGLWNRSYNISSGQANPPVE